MENIGDKTEMIDPEKEEKILDTDKIYDLLNFYKLPLILIFLAILLMGAGILSWQSSQKSAKITFSGEGEIAGTASESAKIKADIEGAVVKPGVYELAFGSRISDLLIIAGGLAEDADREWITKNLNQAGKVLDGGKMYIPRIDEVRSGKLEVGTGSGTGGESGMALIKINSASLSELDTLPGVGAVTAQKIIDGRPYQTIEELLSRKIIGKSVFEKIKDLIGM